MNLFVKSDTGTYEPKDIDLVEFFKENSDDEGNVTLDHILRADCEIKKDKDGRYKWVLSDFSLDSDKERIDPKGWDLKEYKSNPIVLWSHDIWTPAIGKVENLRKTDEGLIGFVSFDQSGLDPLAARIDAKVDQGIITKGSVGFRSVKIEIIDDDKDLCRLIHRKQKLREFSICNIPANMNASEQRMEREDIDLEIFRQFSNAMREKLDRELMTINAIDEEETFAEFAKRRIETSPTIWDELFSGDDARPAEAQDQGLKYLFSDDDETMSIGEILGQGD